MAVLYTPETEYAKERVKYEANHSELGAPGRPYVYREYPTRMFKAGRPDNGLGAHVIVDEAEAGNANDEQRLMDQGFRKDPREAIKVLDRYQEECAALAAELNYEQKNKLSENAAAEVETARAQHVGDSRHMPTVPVTPIKPKRGRKAKPQES